MKNIIKALILPGGKLPCAAPGNPRGYDTFLSRIVSKEWDPKIYYQRTTLWDFATPSKKTPASVIANLQHEKVNGVEQWVYVLKPGANVYVGMGVVFGMESDWCAWIARRSSSAGKKIRATMDPMGSPITPELAEVLDWYVEVPIDSDFRGEPMTELENAGKEEILLSYGQRITQLIFQGPDNNWHPQFEPVSSILDLGETLRANGDHGSSGSHALREYARECAYDQK